MLRRLFDKISHFVITLRFSILSVFISLFLISMFVLMLVTSIHYTKSLTYIARELMKYTSTNLLHSLSMELQPALVEASLSAHLLEQGVLNEKEPELGLYIFNLVKSLPYAVAAHWGDQQGNFIYSKRLLDGSYIREIYNRHSTPATHTIQYLNQEGVIVRQESSSDLTYDPRRRIWFQLAKKEKKAIWTNFYHFQPVPDLGITTAAPVFRQGQFYGAFGFDINLEYLSSVIRQQKIREHGFAFIISKKGKMVAYPDNASFLQLKPASGDFIDVYKDTVPLIGELLDDYIRSGDGSRTFIRAYDGKHYMVSFEPVPAVASYGWLIGIIVPERDFTSDLHKMHTETLIISLLILLFGVLSVSALITRIMRPVKFLVKETEHIKEFDLDYDSQVKSRIKEIINLKEAIRSMKVGLKLFQRYIPKILVQQLIESGQDVMVGGSRKRLAILFTDIENFATLGEKIEPNALMQQLSEYFEALSQILMDEKATIDKYIGDSIMAFWGAPLPQTNLCRHAASAALRCQKTLTELNGHWEQQGKPRLFTRIGIHVGEAIVGNLGSSERLNYTAIGDSINIASRLEGINKFYRSKIIVSEAVYEEIKDQFVLRMLDCVVVRGRSQSCFIYELLGRDLTEVPFDVIEYRQVFAKAYALWQQRHWEEALIHFNHCLEIYPADTIAPIYIQRCRQFQDEPPSPDWNGVMT